MGGLCKRVATPKCLRLGGKSSSEEMVPRLAIPFLPYATLFYLYYLKSVIVPN